jgi:hypothetical protein
MKNYFSFLIAALMLFGITLSACSGKKKDTEKAKNDSLDSVKVVVDSLKKIEDAKPKVLIISGTNVNLRVEPNLKAVRIRQLKTNDTCEILEKGKQETIDGTTDFWYKIRHKTKEGWIFGAFTSIKQAKETQEKSKTFTPQLKSK